MSTVFRVEKTGNYTVMSNMHLKDRRLSYKSKGLLSVILSLPPEWDYTITGLAVIAADGVESVKTAVKELERYGYVSRRQTRDERGRMSVNEYLVYENPAENPAYVPDEQTEELPAANAPDYVEPAPKSVKSSPKRRKSASFSVSPSADLPSAEKPSTVNADAATISKLNKNKLYTEKSNHSVNRAPREDGIDLIDASQTNVCFSSVNEWEGYHELISENINYSRFAGDISVSGDVEEMVTIMTDVICSNSPTVRVNGMEMSHELVKNRFLKLTDEDIDYVLYSLKHNAGRIANIRSYLITTLFNSYTTKGNYFSSMAYSDIREGRI